MTSPPNHTDGPDRFSPRALASLLREGDRAALREAVVALAARVDLKHDGDPVGAPAKAGLAQNEPKAGAHPSPMGAGMFCGPFRIEGELGHGGMGTVYLATRGDDLDLKVAIKTLSAWPPKLLDQFRKECKILSGLTHPGIAHLIDAGVLPNGQPWLAMEYIDGETLGVFLKNKEPSLNQRLTLFLKICEALSHAHQHMVIHRDLKPANIVITAEGTPKLLDFGIAAFLDPETGEQKTVTLMADRVMTPEYASPEQINGLRLNATSDVYSMGMILYELLTGTRPYSFKNTSILELARTVNETSISRPSIAGGDAVPLVPGRLRGDLDTIVLKALERDPERRYGSIEALAGDLRRYLMGLPITARPATRLYRLRKFIGRNTWPVATGCGLLLCLVVFAVYAQFQRNRIQQERDLAQQERQTAESVTDFLMSMFEQVDPDLAKGGEVTAYEVMETGRRQLDRQLAEAPVVRARLMTSMGKVYRALGHYEPALALLGDALENNLPQDQDWSTRMQLVLTQIEAGAVADAEQQIEALSASGAEMDGKTRSTLSFLQGRLWQTRGNPRKAVAFLDSALAAELPLALELVFRKARTRVNAELGHFGKCIDELNIQLKMEQELHGEHHSSLTETLTLLAKYHMEQDDYPRAQSLLDQAEEMLHTLFGENHPRLISLLKTQADLCLYTSELQRAEAYIDKALAMSEALLGENHPKTAECLTAKARIKTHMGEYDKAESLMRQSLALNTSIYGSQNKEVANSLMMLCNLLRLKGDLKAAERLASQAVTIFSEQFGEYHPDLAVTLGELALIYQDMGSLDKAVPLLERALAINKEVLGPDHHKIGYVLLNLGQIFENKAQLSLAESYYVASLDILDRAFGEGNAQASATLNSLANLLWMKGKFREALPYYRKSNELNRSTLGNDHYFVGITTYNVGSTLMMLGQATEAEAFLNEALRINTAAMGDQHPFGGQIRSALTKLHLEMGRYDQATDLIQAAVATLVAVHGKDHNATINAIATQALVLIHQGNLAEAARSLRDLLPRTNASLPSAQLRYIQVRSNLAQCLIFQGRLAEAKQYLTEADAIAESMPHPYQRAKIFQIQAQHSRAEGNLEQAKQWLQQALPILEAQLGKAHYRTGMLKLELAALFLDTNHIKLATELAEEAERVLRASLPPEHEAHAVLKAIAGQAVCGSRGAEGPAQIEEALATLRTRLGEDHYLTREVRARRNACRQ